MLHSLILLTDFKVFNFYLSKFWITFLTPFLLIDVHFHDDVFFFHIRVNWRPRTGLHGLSLIRRHRPIWHLIIDISIYCFYTLKLIRSVFWGFPIKHAWGWNDTILMHWGSVLLRSRLVQLLNFMLVLCCWGPHTVRWLLARNHLLVKEQRAVMEDPLGVWALIH